MDSRRRGNYEVGDRTDEMGCLYAGGWRQGCGAKGFPHPWTPAPYRGTGHAFDRRSDELGVCFRSNR